MFKRILVKLCIPLLGVYIGSILGCDHTVMPSGIHGLALEHIEIGAVSKDRPPTIRPLQDAIIIVKPVGGGAEIARQSSDSQGMFSISLPAGTYLIVPERPPGQFLIPNPSPQTVVVPAGSFASIQVTYFLIQP